MACDRGWFAGIPAEFETQTLGFRCTPDWRSSSDPHPPQLGEQSLYFAVWSHAGGSIRVQMGSHLSKGPLSAPSAAPPGDGLEGSNC